MAWDRYSYTYNNPIRYSDPTGHMVADDMIGGCRSEGCKAEIFPVVRAATTAPAGQTYCPLIPSEKVTPMIPTFPTITPSPTAYYGLFTAEGPWVIYTASGIYFKGDPNTVYAGGVSSYRLEYKADFALINQGSTWSLTINEQFHIGETSGGLMPSITSTYIEFYYPDRTEQRVNLSTINGGFFSLDEPRSTTINMQVNGQYPIDAIVFITPSIGQAYMQNPIQGTNFEYKFTKENWVKR